MRLHYNHDKWQGEAHLKVFDARIVKGWYGYFIKIITCEIFYKIDINPRFMRKLALDIAKIIN